MARTINVPIGQTLILARTSACINVRRVGSSMLVKMSAVIVRCFFLCSAVALFTDVAFGQGSYQRTKDGKTIVWNNHREAGDLAGWWGDRDREGYATGFGTLTWYKAQAKGESTKYVVYARYFGNMVRGKFEGPVNAHSQGKTAHADFVDGRRTSSWAPGTAPSRRVAELGVESARKRPRTAQTQKMPPLRYGAEGTEPLARDIPGEGPPRVSTTLPDEALAPPDREAKAAAQNRNETARQQPPPQPDLAKGSHGPTPTTATAQPDEALAPPDREAKPAAQNRSETARQQTAPQPALPKGSGTPSLTTATTQPTQTAKQASGKPQVKTAKAEMDNPLRRLTHPPSNLHRERMADASRLFRANPANPRLTRQEVIDLADAEARSHGYDPAEYQRPEPQYDPSDETWSLLYQQRPGDGMVDVGKHFSVAVDDKTKNISVVPERF
jgi:hypothetical protein